MMTATNGSAVVGSDKRPSARFTRPNDWRYLAEGMPQDSRVNPQTELRLVAFFDLIGVRGRIVVGVFDKRHGFRAVFVSECGYVTAVSRLPICHAAFGSPGGRSTVPPPPPVPSGESETCWR
jgi:hypothetical protein